MTDKERLEEMKNSCLEGVHILFGTSWVSMPKENFNWLIEQAEHRQKLLERLNKQGIERRKLKTQLSLCREKIKNLEWNQLVLKGTAEQAMRANKSNYELTNKLKEENKRLREALEFYVNGNHYMVYYDKIILLDDGETARKALEGAK